MRVHTYAHTHMCVYCVHVGSKSIISYSAEPWQWEIRIKSGHYFRIHAIINIIIYSIQSNVFEQYVKQTDIIIYYK